MYKRPFFFFSKQSFVQEIFSLRSKLEGKNKENEDLKTRQVQMYVNMHMLNTKINLVGN